MASIAHKKDKDFASRISLDVNAIFATRHHAKDGEVHNANSRDITTYSELLDAVAHAGSDEEAATLVIAAVESAISRNSVEDLEEFQVDNELSLLNILDSDPDRIDDENDAFIGGVIREHLLNGGDVTLIKDNSENAHILIARQQERKEEEAAEHREKMAVLSAAIDKRRAVLDRDLLLEE